MKHRYGGEGILFICYCVLSCDVAAIIVKAGHLSNFGKPFQPSGSVLLNLVAEPSSCNVVLDINIILAHDLLIIHFYCVLLNMGSVVHMSGFICVLK